MKRNLSILTFFLFLSLLGFSQQEPQISHYMFNNLGFNPAYAGMNNAICANLTHRQQWVGVEGRPVTTLFTGDAAFAAIHGGVGLTILQDNIGKYKDLDVKLAYAYHTVLGAGKLSGGLQVGFFNKKLDFSKFTAMDPNDETISKEQSKQSALGIDMSFGLFYSVKDKLYAGLSSTQLIQSKETLGKADYRLKRHYYLTAGYHISLENLGLTGFNVIPSTLIKTDGVSNIFDINALIEYNNKFWAGVSYRKEDAIVIMLGLKPFGPGMYENLKVGYSYDVTTSKMSKGGSSGSHEIYLGYCFKIEVQKPAESYKNVRFL